jgi:hypothetical protein
MPPTRSATIPTPTVAPAPSLPTPSSGSGPAAAVHATGQEHQTHAVDPAIAEAGPPPADQAIAPPTAAATVAQPRVVKLALVAAPTVAKSAVVAAPPVAAPAVVRTVNPTPVRFEVAAGFLASLAGSAFAAGARAEILVAPARLNLAGRLALQAMDVREEALGRGRARWTRAAVAIGPDYRLRPGRFVIDFHAEFLAALLVIEGVGFDVGQRAFDFDPGLGGGVRAAIKAGPATPYIGASIAGWLRRQEGRVDGVLESVEIPRFEVFLTAGVGLGSFF